MTGKFASITANILARKGEARPWEEPDKPTFSWRSDIARIVPPPVIAEPAQRPEPPKPPPVATDAMRRCSLRLSVRDYERLGIAAVKRNTTRQQLLQQSLDRLLASLGETCGDCRCLEPCKDA
jgi:hypothetical protein